MVQVHDNSHGGTIFPEELLLKVPTFINIKYLVDGCNSNSLHISRKALLCECKGHICVVGGN